MPTEQLTVSADAEVIRRLESLAAKQNTSVALLLTRLLEGVARAAVDRSTLPPVTRSALGLFKGMPNRPDRELLTDALLEKYRLPT